MMIYRLGPLFTFLCLIYIQVSAGSCKYNFGPGLDDNSKCIMCIYALQKINKLVDFAKNCPDSINLKRKKTVSNVLWKPDVE